MGMFSHDEMEMVRDRERQELETKLRKAKDIIKRLDYLLDDATEAPGTDHIIEKHVALRDEMDELGL